MDYSGGMSDQATDHAIPTFTYEPDAAAGSFVMLIAQENTPTVDGRMFTANSIDWRPLPLPLTINRLNTPEGQHKTAESVGMIHDIWRDGDFIYGKGYFASDEAGQDARRLIKEGVIAHVSADVGGVTSEELDVDTEYPEGVRKVLTKGTILGVTALLHSSFNETKIAVDETPITAAGGERWEPEAKWFDNPRLTGPTPLTITADGQVFGHAALWGTCHVGYKDRCVTPPRSSSNYAYFAKGTVLTSDGMSRRVGRITANTGHASMELSAAPAAAHYDDTGFGAAFVSAGEDEFGIWYAGATAPEATYAQIANMRAAGVSGDWRSISGALDMVGLLAVNTPGFPLPNPQIGMVAGAQMSLVAAGIVFGNEKYKVTDGKQVDDPDYDEDTAYSEGGARITVGDSQRPNSNRTLVTASGMPCDGHCTSCDECKRKNSVKVTESVDMTAEDDCGCVPENFTVIEFDMHEYMGGAPVNWATDLDQTYLAAIQEKLEDVSESVAQANDYGSPLGLQVQAFGAWIGLLVDQQVAYINRSLGRPVEDVEDATESNDVPEMTYEVEQTEALAVAARIAILDADLLVSAFSASKPRKRKMATASY